MVDRAAGLEAGLSDVREKALEVAASARENFQVGTNLLRDYIVKEPTRALGIAVGMGVILGWLIKRR